jgi:hypothetical protein
VSHVGQDFLRYTLGRHDHEASLRSDGFAQFHPGQATSGSRHDAVDAVADDFYLVLPFVVHVRRASVALFISILGLTLCNVAISHELDLYLREQAYSLPLVDELGMDRALLERIRGVSISAQLRGIAYFFGSFSELVS